MKIKKRHESRAQFVIIFAVIKLRGKPLPSGGGRIARAALAALENP